MEFLGLVIVVLVLAITICVNSEITKKVKKEKMIAASVLEWEENIMREAARCEEAIIMFSLLKDELYNREDTEVKLLKGEYCVDYSDERRGPKVMGPSLSGDVDTRHFPSYCNGFTPLECLDQMVTNCFDTIRTEAEMVRQKEEARYNKQRDIAEKLIVGIPYGPDSFELAMKQAEDFM